MTEIRTPPPALFLSYPGADREEASALALTLRARGLGVWMDLSDISPLQGITPGVREGLGQSRLLVALYTPAFLESRACQWELAAAWRAGVAAGDPTARIAVVIPPSVRSVHHIEPSELRDVAVLWWRNEADLPRIADALEARTASLREPMGLCVPAAAPRWFPWPRVGSSRFVGRGAELWRVHGALSRSRAVMVTGHPGADTVQLRGLGGVGKSLLAEEYAVRFGASWPGGIYWLSALGGEGGPSAEATETHRVDTLLDLAARLGLPCGGQSPQAVEAMLAHRLGADGLPFLWVVDDLPSGLPPPLVQRWLAPHPLGATLITTRDRAHSALGVSMDLGVLPSEESRALLISRRPPRGEAEDQAADALTETLGGHPLALDVAGAALAVWPGTSPYAGFRSELAHPDRDALELAAQLADQLPNGHEASISATLLRSVRALGEEGRDLLRLAAALAPAPISTRLFAAAFALADGLSDSEALGRTAFALRQVDLASLAERVAVEVDDAASGRSVHPLVSRVVRFYDARPLRRLALADAVTNALPSFLHGVDDPREHRSIASVVAHARALTAHVDTLASAELGSLVANYDHARGDWSRAIEENEAALAVQTELLGAEHEKVLVTRMNLLEARRSTGNLEVIRAEQERLVAEMTQLLGPDSPLTLSARHNFAGTVSHLGWYSQAVDAYVALLEDMERVLGEDHPDRLRTTSNLAETLRAGGALTQSCDLQRATLAARRSMLGEDHPDTIISENNLAGSLLSLGAYEEARAILEGCLRSRQRLLGELHPDTLSTANNLATALCRLGAHTEALALLEGAWSALRQRYGEAYRPCADIRNNLGEVCAAAGRFEEARAHHEAVLDVQRRTLGVAHPDTLRSLNNLAAVVRELGDLPGARALMEVELSLSRETLGEEHPEVLTSMNNLATMLADLGDLAAARALEEEALAIRLRTLGRRHPDTALAMMNFADTLRRMGDIEAARPLCEEALETRRLALGADHPDTLITLCNLGGLSVAVGAWAEAIPMLEQAVTGLTAALGDEHANVLTALNNLASAYADSGDLARARPLEERALAIRRKQAGPRHFHTTTSAWNLLSTLLEIGLVEEARALYQSELQWLLQESPETLHPEQASIREKLEALVREG